MSVTCMDCTSLRPSMGNNHGSSIVPTTLAPAVFRQYGLPYHVENCLHPSERRIYISWRLPRAVFVDVECLSCLTIS